MMLHEFLRQCQRGKTSLGDFIVETMLCSDGVDALIPWIFLSWDESTESSLVFRAGGIFHPLAVLPTESQQDEIEIGTISFKIFISFLLTGQIEDIYGKVTLDESGVSGTSYIQPIMSHIFNRFKQKMEHDFECLGKMLSDCENVKKKGGYGFRCNVRINK